MNWPISSQKYGRCRNGRCAISRTPAQTEKQTAVSAARNSIRLPARCGMPLLLDDASRVLRFEPDFTESAFVLTDVLLEDIEQGFCLLGTDIDALKILNRHTFRSSLIHSAEQQQEVPQVDAYLNAVGIIFPVVRRLRQLNFGSRRLSHSYQGIIGTAGGLQR